MITHGATQYFNFTGQGSNQIYQLANSVAQLENSAICMSKEAKIHTRGAHAVGPPAAGATRAPELGIALVSRCPWSCRGLSQTRSDAPAPAKGPAAAAPAAGP